MIVNLRQAPSALSQVAQWQFQQWGWMVPGQTVHDRMARLQEQLSNQPVPSTFVAFHNDFLAGAVSLVVCDLPEYPALTPWLANLLVAPGYRSKGIGARLVRHAEQAAYDAGYDSLFLHTGNALDYFLDRGWDPIHTMQRHGGQVVIMERDLTVYATEEPSTEEPSTAEQKDLPPTEPAAERSVE